MKRIAFLLCCALFVLTACAKPNDDAATDLPHEMNADAQDEYVDEYGYPLPGAENYEKWYNDKLKKVVDIHKEVEFLYGRILLIEKTENGDVRVELSADKDMDMNHRQNYSFFVTDNTYIKHNYADLSKDELLVGQNVFISFAYSSELLEYSGVQSVSVFSLFVLDDDPKNPSPLLPEDYQHYDFEGEIEIEADIEEDVEVEVDVGEDVLE